MGMCIVIISRRSFVISSNNEDIPRSINEKYYENISKSKEFINDLISDLSDNDYKQKYKNDCIELSK